jgi:hypothetical protein
VNATSNQMTTIHELFHQAFATIDSYAWDVGQLDIMGPTLGVAEDARWLPNAVTRFQLGWLRPTVVESDAAPVLGLDDAVIVRDPSASATQFFVVEYRHAGGLDRNASASGVVLWRVVTSTPRRVELITPDVIASDTRVSGCENGCRRGSPTDAFAPNSNQPIALRYLAASPRYSAGAFSGMVLTPVSGDGGAAQIRVQFNTGEPTTVHAPAATAPTAVSAPRVRVASTAASVSTSVEAPTVEQALVPSSSSQRLVAQLELAACVLDLPACSPALLDQVLNVER